MAVRHALVYGPAGRTTRHGLRVPPPDQPVATQAPRRSRRPRGLPRRLRPRRPRPRPRAPSSPATATAPIPKPTPAPSGSTSSLRRAGGRPSPNQQAKWPRFWARLRSAASNCSHSKRATPPMKSRYRSALARSTNACTAIHGSPTLLVWRVLSLTRAPNCAKSRTPLPRRLIPDGKGPFCPTNRALFADRFECPFRDTYALTRLTHALDLPPIRPPRCRLRSPQRAARRFR